MFFAGCGCNQRGHLRRDRAESRPQCWHLGHHRFLRGRRTGTYWHRHRFDRALCPAEPQATDGVLSALRATPALSRARLPALRPEFCAAIRSLSTGAYGPFGAAGPLRRDECRSCRPELGTRCLPRARRAEELRAGVRRSAYRRRPAGLLRVTFPLKTRSIAAGSRLGMERRSECPLTLHLCVSSLARAKIMVGARGFGPTIPTTRIIVPSWIAAALVTPACLADQTTVPAASTPANLAACRPMHRRMSKPNAGGVGIAATSKR